MPVYIHTGGQDKSMPPANQSAQKALFENYGAKIMYVENAESGHNMPSETPAEGLSWILGNIPGTGIEDGYMPEADTSLSQGNLIAFNQGPFIDAAVAEHVDAGGSPDVDHRIDYTRPGYYFVPR